MNKLEMTKFDKRVLDLISKIPEGKVSTYKQVAIALGKPKAARAVGNALSKNPNPVEIPCHRVVKSSGTIGGYRLGRDKKVELLRKEGVEVIEGKIDLEKYFFEDFE